MKQQNQTTMKQTRTPTKFWRHGLKFVNFHALNAADVRRRPEFRMVESDFISILFRFYSDFISILFRFYFDFLFETDAQKVILFRFSSRFSKMRRSKKVILFRFSWKN